MKAEGGEFFVTQPKTVANGERILSKKRSLMPRMDERIYQRK